MKESIIENKLTTLIHKAGGYCVKFTSPSLAGVPDRIIWYHGQTLYVELKAPGKKPRKQQEVVHQIMLQHGLIVYVLDTIEKVQAFVDELIHNNGKIINQHAYQSINEQKNTIHFQVKTL